jgi:hypothetical protein
MEVAVPLEFALGLSILFALLGAEAISLSGRVRILEKQVKELRAAQKEEVRGSDGQ